jgi:hypothetical protein
MDFIETAIPHVWQHTKSGLYTFSDETSNFVGMYWTEEEAMLALNKYVRDMKRYYD